MNNTLLEFPTQFESARLSLRSYRPGDGKWYYAMSLRNREHLMKYESENVATNLSSEEAAEELVEELANEWIKRTCFFIGAFDKKTGDFVAQIYVGPVNWSLPEFQIGYFADVEHEGQGYVTEAVKATLRILFTQLNAHRVRLGCDETNVRSIRVAERCHMIREGYLRENKRNPDGTFSSSLIYGLLKSEYKDAETDEAR
jgi:RimJ/RimL family protein N-acetyltransferase